jgi:hypothetical protein
MSAEAFIGTTGNDPSFSGDNVGPTPAGVNFYLGDAGRISAEDLPVTWTGNFTPRQTATYTFLSSDEQALTVRINGQTVISAGGAHWGTITLEASQQYAIEVDYHRNTGQAAQLYWVTSGQPMQSVNISAEDTSPSLAPPTTSNFTPPTHTTASRVEMENFDAGAHRTAYFDRTSGNEGGSYRLTHADIEATTDTGGGFNLGYTMAGEWLQYTVSASGAGYYDIQFRVTSAGQGGAFHVEIDGVNMTGPITVDDTGGWQNWQTITATGIALKPGENVLKIVMETNGDLGRTANFNWFQLSASTLPAPEVTLLFNGSELTSNQTGPIDFGSVETGSDGTTLTFTVKNDGEANLALGAVQLPAGYTLVESLSTSLLPGGSDTFTVRLDTSVSGSRTGEIRIGTNDADENPFIIAITGQVAAVTGTILTPGQGFDGPTTVPIGPNDGQQYSDAKAIARWDVVPYQTFDGNFNVGVVAFHAAGIDRVEFSVNGGPWTAVREMTLNPRTNVVEYWATLRAQDFADGALEVRAIAFPKVGQPRLLEPLMLNANAHGTLETIARYVSPTGSDETGDGSMVNPFATMMKAARSIQDASGTGTADGGVIYLLAGDHTYGGYSYSLLTTTENRWLTVTAAPGVAQEDVRVVNAATNDGLRTKLVHFDGLTFAAVSGADQGLFTSNGPLTDFLWIDNSNLVGPGRAVDASWIGGWSGVYATDTNVSNSRDGMTATLVRNVHVSDIGSDAFSNSGIVINSSVRNIDPSGTSFHADVVQYYSTGLTENRIVYGLDAIDGIKGQGLFAGSNISIKDIAFVNVKLDNSQSNMYAFQFGGPTNHMVVLDSQITGSAAWRYDLGFTGYNILIGNSLFSSPLKETDGVTTVEGQY